MGTEPGNHLLNTSTIGYKKWRALISVLAGVLGFME